MTKFEILDYWENYLKNISFDTPINIKVANNNAATFISSEIDLNKLNIQSMSDKEKDDKNSIIIAYIMLTLAFVNGTKKCGAMICSDCFMLPLFLNIYDYFDINSLILEIKSKIELYNDQATDFLHIVKYLDNDECIYDEREYIHIYLTDQIKKRNYSQVILTDNKINFELNVNKEYHIESIINIFKGLLDTFEKNPLMAIKDFNFSKIDYYKNIILDSSGEERTIPENVNLGQLFKIAAENNPYMAAIIFDDRIYNYSSVYVAVQNMVAVLNKIGIDKNKRCIVLCRQDIDTIILLMALVYMGAVIVPLDKKYPYKKLKITKENINSSFVLSSVKNDEIEELIVLKANFSELNNEFLPVINDEMYVTFTSGTTGVPKSISISCSDFYNLHIWYCDKFRLSNDSRNLLLTNFGFDAAIKNFISPLLCGAVLVLANDELFNIKEIVRIIENCKVTNINCVPSLFAKILEYSAENNYKQLESIKYVALGGEKFPPDIASKWAESPYFNSILMNVYGPAEATDLSSYYLLNKSELNRINAIPLGKPLYNKKLYVFDENMFLCPVNEKGELCISGKGVINSYINKSDNKNRFFEHIGLPNEKIYRTGDIVYRDSDGNFIYSGRKDNQIKYNGQRIELEEIESIIEKYDTVSKTMAKIYKQDGKSDILAAFYISSDKKEINSNDLYEHCKKWINVSMIPSKFIMVEDIPLTLNGKLDRTWDPGIPEEKSVNNESDFSDTEKRVANVWKKVLSISNISKDIQFFEAGGSSLLLTQLQSKLEDEFDIDISVIDLLELTTISKIAKFIDEDEDL